MVNLKILLIALTFVSVNNSYSQLTKKETKKITKIIGDAFTQKECQYIDPNSIDKVVIDTSTTIANVVLGQHLNDEYINDSPSFYDEHAIYFVKDNLVSNKEYLEFKNWVRDSIARDKIYFDIEDDSEILNWLLFEESFYDKVNQKIVLTKDILDEREFLREYFPLNWNEKLEYDDPMKIPFIYDMYLPPHERWNRQKEFDERKFVYKYIKLNLEALNDNSVSIDERRKNAILEMKCNVKDDSYAWAKYSNEYKEQDVWSVLGQKYAEFYPEEPVIGVLPSQAESYCYWKQTQLQKDLNLRGLAYDVSVEIAGVSDVNPKGSRITIPESNYSEHWRITNEEFKEFQTAVLDSAWKEYLYENYKNKNLSLKLLEIKEIYFDESVLDYVEMDPTDKLHNRQVFNFKSEYPKNWKTEPFDEMQIKFEEKIAKQSLEYRYVAHLTQKRSLQPSYIFKELDNVEFYEAAPSYIDGEYEYYKSYTYDYNQNCVTGVRLNQDYTIFYDYRMVDVFYDINLELDNESKDKSAYINYDHAIAYYNWKYPIWKMKKGDNLHQFVYPTQEEFEKAQSGEVVIEKEKIVELPTPSFRYIIKFTNKMELEMN